MKVAILLVTALVMCIAEMSFANSNTDSKECLVACTHDYNPICGMEVTIAKREFANPCVMERENTCNGGRYVPCQDIK